MSESPKRPLMEEEISLRTLWMNIAYLTLECLYRMESNSADLEFDSCAISTTRREQYHGDHPQPVSKFDDRSNGYGQRLCSSDFQEEP